MTPTFARRIATALLILATTAVALGAPTLREKLRVKVICDETTCTQVPTGTFRLDHTHEELIPTSLTDQFNANTTFNFSCGGSNFDFALNNDSRYTPGDTQVTLRSTATINGRQRIIASFKISWKNGVFKIKAKGIIPPVVSPAAGGLIGTVPGSKTVQVDTLINFQNGPTEIFALNFFDINYPAIVTRTTKTVEGTTYELDTVTVGP